MAQVERSLGRRVFEGVLSIALVGFIFGWAVPRLADYSEIWDALRSLSVVGILAISAAAVANLVTYWWLLVVALPGLSYPKAALAHQASTAVAHTLPAGAAIAVGITYTMYTSWGFAPAPIARSVLITGLWNNLAKFVFPVVALALLALEGDADTPLVVAAVLGLMLLTFTLLTLVLALRRDPLIRALGRWAQAAATALRRPLRLTPVTGWDDAASRFRADAEVLLRERGLELPVATIASQTAIFVVLLVALRALGVSGSEVSWVEALAAFSFVRLASALPLTPGGLGIVELGLLAVLTSGLAAGPTAEVAAAVLLFRFITFVLPVFMGGAAYVVWRNRKS